MTKGSKGFANRPQTQTIKFKDSPIAKVLQKLNNSWDYMVPAIRKDIRENGDLNPLTFVMEGNWDKSVDPRKSFHKITGGGGDFDKVKTVLKFETIFALVRSYESNKSKWNYDIAELKELSEGIASVLKQSGVTHRQYWESLMISDKSFVIDQIIDYLLTGEEVNA